MFRYASNNFAYSNHIYGNDNYKFQIKLVNTNIFLFFCQTNRSESCILQLKMLIFPRLESKLLIAFTSNRKSTVKLNDWMDRQNLRELISSTWNDVNCKWRFDYWLEEAIWRKRNEITIAKTQNCVEVSPVHFLPIAAFSTAVFQ